MSIPTLATYGGFLHDIGYAGGMVNELNADIDNLQNMQALAINYGCAVARDASGQCKAPAADADVILGIATKFPIKAAPGFGQANANTVNFAQNDMVPVLKHGEIYVIAAENVTQDDQALSLTASNGTIGGTTGGAAGAGRIVVPGGKWQTTTAAGMVGIVRITN